MAWAPHHSVLVWSEAQQGHAGSQQGLCVVMSLLQSHRLGEPQQETSLTEVCTNTAKNKQTNKKIMAPESILTVFIGNEIRLARMGLDETQVVLAEWIGDSFMMNPGFVAVFPYLYGKELLGWLRGGGLRNVQWNYCRTGAKPPRRRKIHKSNWHVSTCPKLGSLFFLHGKVTGRFCWWSLGIHFFAIVLRHFFHFWITSHGEESLM